MDPLPPTFVKGFHKEECVRKMKYVKLGQTDIMVSRVSIGGATFCSSFYGQLDEEEATKTLHTALQRGINYIDTAPFYGQGDSERFLGKALKGVPREAYYIATKTGRYDRTGPNQFDFSYERTIQSVDESLQRLGLDYVDVYQLHDVEFAESMDIVIHGSLRACEHLKKIGKIRAIGINGYPLKVLKEGIMMAMNRFDTVLTYGRYTLVDDSLLEYLPFFEQQGLGIINASAHQCGMLRNDGPPSWCFASPLVKQLVKEAGDLCKQYGIELGKIAMYHFLQLKGPATFLVGMEKMEYLNFNLGAYFEGLTAKEVQIYKLMKKTIFSRVPKDEKHWEGIEVARYWEDQKQYQKN